MRQAIRKKQSSPKKSYNARKGKITTKLSSKPLIKHSKPAKPEVTTKKAAPQTSTNSKNLTFVTKEFLFDAAHYLTNYYGKCEKLHGHTYKLHVTIQGQVGNNGLLIDFVLLKKIVKDRILNKLDHSNLNDYFTNPSCELIAHWIWDQLENLPTILKKELDHPNLSEEIKQYIKASDTKIDTSDFQTQIRLYEIKLWETPTSFVTIRAND